MIHPCIWFNYHAHDAAAFYTALFKDAKILATSPYAITVHLKGQKFMLLNGNTNKPINSSVTFFVVCESGAETEHLWNALSESGNILMPLDRYPWSEQYGWLQDRFGVSWQIAFGKWEDVGQYIKPCLLFSGAVNGKAGNAMEHYKEIFPDTSITGILNYDNGENEIPGNIKHAQFSINGFVMMAMDSSMPQPFGFNESVSFVVECRSQQEIDHYWHKLSEGGQESMCGWLKDAFGISWQIIPENLGALITHPEKGPAVAKNLFSMKKIDMELLDQV